jgi:hypothetical protein
MLTALVNEMKKFPVVNQDLGRSSCFKSKLVRSERESRDANLGDGVQGVRLIEAPTQDKSDEKLRDPAAGKTFAFFVEL